MVLKSPNLPKCKRIRHFSSTHLKIKKTLFLHSDVEDKSRHQRYMVCKVFKDTDILKNVFSIQSPTEFLFTIHNSFSLFIMWSIWRSKCNLSKSQSASPFQMGFAWPNINCQGRTVTDKNTQHSYNLWTVICREPLYAEMTIVLPVTRKVHFPQIIK